MHACRRQRSAAAFRVPRSLHRPLHAALRIINHWRATGGGSPWLLLALLVVAHPATHRLIGALFGRIVFQINVAMLSLVSASAVGCVHGLVGLGACIRGFCTLRLTQHALGHACGDVSESERVPRCLLPRSCGPGPACARGWCKCRGLKSPLASCTKPCSGCTRGGCRGAEIRRTATAANSSAVLQCYLPTCLPPHIHPRRHRRVPLLPAGEPPALSLDRRCCALHTWFDLTVGVALPLAVLAALERRGRERLFKREQEAAAGQWWSDDPRCPPRLEPAACFLFSCVAFAASTLAAALLPAPGRP